MKTNKKQFLTGAEVVVRACVDAGAKMMFGYPITPGTEILSHWIREAQSRLIGGQADKSLKYLQTEDEIAAGFCMCGAVMAGEKTFTATAGPGTVLMQDALSMADGMRLPVVVIVVQRGGPSSGTVIYSQQEVNLAIHGGNGEGLRLVYSPSNLTELYEYTRLAFNNAWKYNFPVIVLSDGFLMKTRQLVDLEKIKIKNIETEAIISENTQKNIRNIYTFEEELGEKLARDKKDFEKMAGEVIMSEVFCGRGQVETCPYEELVIAHGIVAGAAKEAVNALRLAPLAQGKKVGLFRPITLSPFPAKELNELAKQAKKIFVVESSMGQLRDLVKQNLEVAVEVSGLYKPAEGIESEEIVKLLNC
ncbi:MAG: ferredoxin oxidoreductase [Candidatus Magasanikbacteria bacterium]|nr:ferredoxin oxidoreductase [Candidatus Magasanikbacteria bacterium]